MNAGAVLLPTATLFIGWLLNEIHARGTIRHKEKTDLGLALAELLDVRHEITVLTEVPKLIAPRIHVPESTVRTVLTAIVCPMLQKDNASSVYNQGLAVIASRSPLIAWSLRSKQNVLPEFFRLVSRVQELPDYKADPSGMETMGRIIGAILVEARPYVEMSCLELARAHGWLTYFRVKRTFRKAPLKSAEVDCLVAQLINAISQAIPGPLTSAEIAKVHPNSNGPQNPEAVTTVLEER